ncbi:AAA family ATPase [Rhodocytophaga rosea]|uniref:AAA family ATPase n=1 Tax=Rhodocytophaga rosea TaxID=2704465 RepID=A0A6C0GM39_9BACT|nr:AAA family ATPase [Rhodocytophaga rosea]QHT68700.1 AAA family ATPase [Rhodocytophaga rosea]
MSTIINSISLCNFYNYYGDYDKNIYEFNAGLNIIVADNGAGKSKLFNGFSWILNDKVFDSDSKEYANIENSMVKMISDKAKDETQVDEEVKCGVKINFSDDKYEYQVEKSLWGKRIAERSVTNTENWICNHSDTKVFVKDKMLLDFRSIYDRDEKKQIINKLIRPEFRQYALLQGEEVDKIIDFSKTESLKKAIDTLSNISKIDSLITLSKYLAEKGEEDLIKAKKQQAKDKDEFDKRVRERESINKNLNQRRIELQKAQEELFKAKEERDQLINFISNAQGRQEIRNNQRIIKSKLTEINNTQSDFLNNLTDKFFDERSAWLLYNTKENGEKFLRLRERYLDKRKEKRIINNIRKGDKSFLTRLPEGSPDSYSLQKMLENEECFVCGRDAKKNSEPWQHIYKVLEAHTKPKDINLEAKHDFTSFLDHLMLYSQSYYNQINRIEDDIKDDRKKDYQYRAQKLELQSKLEQLENERIGLIGSNDEDDQVVINRYGGAERRIQKYEGDIVRLETDIERLTIDLENKNKEIDELSAAKLKNTLLEREDIMKDIYRIAINTKERIFDKIIQKLETSANLYFKELTRENSVDGGIIRIIRYPGDTFAIEIRDQEDNKIFGLSEGFQRMKKLAVIMAIISSSDRGKMDYPLIADAPLSAFGKGFIRGFFDKVPEVFHQSIVMVKDLYDRNTTNRLNDVGEDILEKVKINPGSFHLNEIDKNQPQLKRTTQILRY